MQPRNFFTDAAEWFLGGNREPAMLPATEYNIVTDKIQHWMKNGVFFTLPEDGKVASAEQIERLDTYALLRPPYPVCILEYAADPTANLKVIVVVETIGDVVHIDFMTSAISGGIWTPPAAYCSGRVGEFEYDIKPRLPFYVHNKGKEWSQGRDFKADIRLMLEAMATRVVTEFLMAVHEQSVGAEEVEAPERLNRKRLKRGKVPLFAYKVLTIGKPKRPTEHKGGTHASPRSHLRRGYYRMSRGGVRHWVKPCMVKGETPGFVHKDYKVEKEQTHGDDARSQGQG
jgi:hypothetical protein